MRTENEEKYQSLAVKVSTPGQPAIQPEVAARSVSVVNVGDSRHLYRAARRRYQVYNADLERMPLADSLRGRAAFLVCNGPSLNDLDLSLLRQPGIVTMGLNNGPAVIKPNYWVGVDDPGRFVEQIWKDPTITKFTPLCHLGKFPRVRGAGGALSPSVYPVEGMPNTFFFERNNNFNAASFLLEPTFNWGNWEGQRDEHGITGSRSVLLVALKLLYWLGAGVVYLVGADFKMQLGQANYAFPQDRTKAAVNGNNTMYAATDKRLALAREYFGHAGQRVINCTPNSGLSAFMYKPFDEAITKAAKEVNEKPIVTEGMYN